MFRSRHAARPGPLVAASVTLLVLIAGCGTTGEPTGTEPADGDVTNGEATDEEGTDSETVTDSDEPIVVGFPVPIQSEEVSEGAGAQDVTIGDTQQQLQALVDDLNSRGGLAGRQIEPVWHEINVAAPEGLEPQYEAACATFTQDDPVFAVSTTAQIPASFRSCLEDAGLLLVLTGLTTSDAESLASAPNTFEIALGLDQVADAVADQILEDHSDDMVVGIAAFDAPTFRRAADSLQSQLSEAGVTVVEPAAITEPQSQADFETVASEAANAVLRFKDAGVTDVVFIEQGGAIPLFLMQVAEQQEFRPIYHLTTHDGGQAVVPSLPPEQLSGARLVSWLPVLDVGQTAAPENPGRTRCLDLLAAAGHQFPDPNAELAALGGCEGLFLLEAALDGLEGEVTTEAVRAAIEGLGDSYESAITFETRFGPEQHHGVAAYRLAEFGEECLCFEYTSDVTPLPGG